MSFIVDSGRLSHVPRGMGNLVHADGLGLVAITKTELSKKRIRPGRLNTSFWSRQFKGFKLSDAKEELGKELVPPADDSDGKPGMKLYA